MKVNIKRAFNKKRMIATAAVIVIAVAALVTSPEIKEFFSHSDAVKLTFQTGVEYDMVNYGKDMLLVNNEGIFSIDKSGREAWSAVSAATSPSILVKGKYIMLADINGKTVKTFKKEKLISQIDTENEILCSKMNKNGYVAIATDELGYKGMVLVYDKAGKEIFRWHSGTGYIGDIDISSGNKLAVAQLITDKEEVCTKILVITPNSDKEPVCVAEMPGIVMKLQYRDNGSLIALSNKGLFGFKRSGKPSFEVHYEGKKPIECNIENENNMILAFDSGLNSTILESYSSKGKLRGAFDLGSEIRALDVNGECIVAANREGIVQINPKGTVKKEIDVNKDIKAVKVFEGRDKLLSLGDSSAELIKIR